MASNVGSAIARAIGPWLSVQRVATKNIKQAMPELSDKEVQKITTEMWENLGRTIGEFPHMRKMDKAMFDRYVTVQGAEIFQQVKTTDQHAIFFSGHFANWEMGPKTISMHEVPFSLVYRRANNAFVESLINFTRKSYQGEQIQKGTVGARYLIKALKAKRSIGILVDQKMNDGIAVPFFGRDAMTAPAIANLARRDNCLVVPSQIIRKNKYHFEVILHPPLEIPKGGDDEKEVFSIMLQINKMLEEWIRANPAQWFWVHKRWPKE
jgi:KDO2-lipid IV(A) lauroyltransferase